MSPALRLPAPRGLRRSLRLLVGAAVALATLSCEAPAPDTAARPDTFDVVVRGGQVLDGTGNPWFRADLGIEADRVTFVGDLDGAVGRLEIDATGLFVAPGFIDAHSHASGGLTSEERSDARALLHQGVTTVLINPDGGGPTDIAEQRTELLEHGLGVNAAQMVPHGSVRGEVIGSDDREATPAELERMRELVRTGMEEGAFGLSSGLFYSPGSYAPIEEVVELARVAGGFGGAYTSHIRDESDYTIGLMAAVEEVITVAREAGIPGVVTHVKALGPNVWGLSSEIVARIEAARAEGVEMYADQYPYEASSTGLSAALVPRWAQAGGGSAFRERLDDPEMRARIVNEMRENLARRGGPERIQFASYGSDRSIEGLTLAELAAERGEPALDVALDLVSGGSPSIVSFNMHEDDIRTLMVQDWTMTASDGGLPVYGSGVPHPRSYGTFPRKLRRYALEEGVVTLAQAVRSMTSLPATVFRMADRGVIRAGAYADLVVFDPERIADRATFTEPHQYSEGVVHLFVNGEQAIRGGEPTGTLAGRVLRREGR